MNVADLLYFILQSWVRILAPTTTLVKAMAYKYLLELKQADTFGASSLGKILRRASWAFKMLTRAIFETEPD